MPEAALRGHPASLDSAIAAAATLLGRGRVAVGGLDTDVAGVRAAIGLARRLGATVDHAHAGAALRDLAVMRRAGWIVTTPLQARARADVVLLVGPGLPPDLGRVLLLDEAPPLFPERRRTVIADAHGRYADPLAALGLLRAALAGRAVALPPGLAADLETLRGARYGVAAWSAAHLDEVTIEMLCGLVDDLNAATRWAGLPWPVPGNGAGAMQAAAWLTGLPLPLGFPVPGGVARHDPWRFDAARQVAAGEVDAALWLAPGPPPWGGAVPTVVLSSDAGGVAEVAITVGRPGVDHDAVLFDAALGGLTARRASVPSALPAAGAVLGRIAEALPC